MTELRTILLAEDNANDVELTLAALRENHLANDVAVVRDGGLPAVLLLDLKMPKVDGLEVLRQLKGDPDMRTMPIVILTSSREERDLVRSYDLGVNAYVVKPVEFHDFVDAIKMLGGFWAVVNEPPPSAGTVHA